MSENPSIEGSAAGRTAPLVEGKIAIVTGGASGNGRETCLVSLGTARRW